MRYRERLLGTLKPGGTAIIATFAPDGPEKCSGLAGPALLAAVLWPRTLGARFALVESAPHVHTTPWGRYLSRSSTRASKGCHDVLLLRLL